MAIGRTKILEIIGGFDKVSQQVAQLPKETRAELFKSTVIYKIKDKTKEAAFQYFMNKELDSDTKSRISLFIIAIKSANIAVLKNFELQPVDSCAYAFLHAQLYKECELISKLQHLSPWSTTWEIYVKAAEFNLKLWKTAEVSKYLLGFFKIDRHLYEYLALSYALLSEVNFMSVITMKNIDNDPYVQMLHDLEDENGKMIQVQLRLLKDIDVPLSREEREKIVEDKRQMVLKLFDEFLASLCATNAATVSPA